MGTTSKTVDWLSTFADYLRYAVDEVEPLGLIRGRSKAIGEHSQGSRAADRGDALHGEGKEPRNLRVGRQPQGSGHIERDHRLGGVPHHQRLVVVGAVLTVGEECGYRVPPLLGRHPLQGAGDVEPHEWRGVRFCKLSETLHRGRRRRS